MPPFPLLCRRDTATSAASSLQKLQPSLYVLFPRRAIPAKRLIRFGRNGLPPGKFRAGRHLSLPPLPFPGHGMEKGRQAAPPPSTGPAPFSFSQKNSAFSLPAPASGESPGHDCGNLLSRLPHRGKAVTPRSVPHVFPARKTGCLSPSEGSRPSPRALAKGFVMRTSGRPAHRRKHRFSPPACIPPAHGPSGCRR